MFTSREPQGSDDQNPMESRRKYCVVSKLRKQEPTFTVWTLVRVGRSPIRRRWVRYLILCFVFNVTTMSL